MMEPLARSRRRPWSCRSRRNGRQPSVSLPPAAAESERFRAPAQQLGDGPRQVRRLLLLVMLGRTRRHHVRLHCAGCFLSPLLLQLPSLWLPSTSSGWLHQQQKAEVPHRHGYHPLPARRKHSKLQPDRRYDWGSNLWCGTRSVPDRRRTPGGGRWAADTGRRDCGGGLGTAAGNRSWLNGDGGAAVLRRLSGS
jgi:hypothetical protein